MGVHHDSTLNTYAEQCVYNGYLPVYRLFRTTADDPNRRFAVDVVVVDAFIKLGMAVRGHCFLCGALSASTRHLRQCGERFKVS